MQKLLVRFSVQGIEIKGEIESAPAGVAWKIVFLEGYRPETAGRYRGVLPKNGEQWVCALVRDTQPGARKGALIVNPLRRAVWLWREVGEAVFGVRRHVAWCPEVPEAGEHFAPFSREEVEARNASFRAAEARNRIWENGSLSSILKEFGPVTALEPQDDDRMITLVFSHGRKAVQKDELKFHVTTSPTGQWRAVGEQIEAEYAFDDLPTATVWNLVGSTDPRFPRVTDSRLSAATRNEILAFVRARVATPEVTAETAWSELLKQDGEKIARLRKQRRDLRGPGPVRIRAYSRRQTIYYGPSEDEYRPGGSYEGTVRGWSLLIGYRDDATSFSSIFEAPSGDIDPEELRAEYLVRTDKQLQEALVGYPLSPSFEITGLTMEEWNERFMTMWNSLRSNAEQAWVEEDATLVATAHTEWSMRDDLAAEFHRVNDEMSAIQSRFLRSGVTVPEGMPYWARLETLGNDDLRAQLVACRNWIETSENKLAAELHTRGAREIAARASEEDRKRAIDAAMNAPAQPAPWYVIDRQHLAGLEISTGRKVGEGLGERLVSTSSRETRYLPGDRALVVLEIGGGSVNRYSYGIEARGLTPLAGFSLPESAGGRHGATLGGIVIDPDWAVLVTDYEHGAVTSYSVYCAEGVGYLSAYEGGSNFASSDWDRVSGEGLGPSENKVRTVLGLAPRKSESSVVSVRQSVIEEVAQRGEFTYLSKRDFRCPRGHTARLTSGEYARYQGGESVEITCTVCKVIGTISPPAEC